MTARHTITAPTSYVAIDGRDEAPDGDGFLFDNADSFRCEAQHFKGAGAVLGRSTPPMPNHPDMPTLSYFFTQFCGDGVVVKAVDWMIDHARICGVKGHGLDVWQGNLHESFSKIYGTDIGLRVRPSVAICNFQGTEVSDSRIGALIQGNETSITNLFAEHNSQCGVLVGAKSLINGLRVNTDRDILDLRPNRKPATCIEFANSDSEFGYLCANWSTLTGASFDVLPGDTAIVANAHMLTLTGLHVNGEPDATALLVEQPIDGFRYEATICGPAILIRQLGSNCDINIRFHQTRPRIELPSKWNNTNTLRLNGEVQKPKDKP